MKISQLKFRTNYSNIHKIISVAMLGKDLSQFSISILNRQEDEGSSNGNDIHLTIGQYNEKPSSLHRKMKRRHKIAKTTTADQIIDTCTNLLPFSNT